MTSDIAEVDCERMFNRVIERWLRVMLPLCKIYHNKMLFGLCENECVGVLTVFLQSLTSNRQQGM